MSWPNIGYVFLLALALLFLPFIYRWLADLIAGYEREFMTPDLELVAVICWGGAALTLGTTIVVVVTRMLL